MPYADERTPPEGVSEVEGSAEDPAGRGAEGDREVEDPGSFRRCEVWPGGTGFPCYYGCGRLVPAAEEDVDAGSNVLEWELRKRLEREEERGAEVGALRAEEEAGAGEELPLFLPIPSLMASAGEE